MNRLLVQDTSTQLWQSFVKEAASSIDIQLNEELESYLVFLLMRFMREPGLVLSVLALDFLQAQQALPAIHLQSMKEVGDKCLLFSGLFPGNAQRKQVNLNYFVRLGRSAYANVAESSEKSLAELYEHLSHEFVVMMDVLLASWEVNVEQQLFPLEIYEIWQLTRHPRWRQHLYSFRPIS